MSIHEHQWVFAGEVVIPTSETEVPGDPFNRLEYCIVCGAFRIKFRSQWRFWYSDATKMFLKQFDRESHKVLKLPPSEFKLLPPVRRSQRLGRGLPELMREVQRQGIPKLLKGKPDAKD